MHPVVRANGEGARTASLFSGMASTPLLAVWPVFGAAAIPTPESAEQIYRMALELARAALLPSPYERAVWASYN
jgi:hypothetical protein